LISDLGAGDLVVLDAPARKEIKRVKLGSSAEGILIGPTDLTPMSRCRATITLPS